MNVMTRAGPVVPLQDLEARPSVHDQYPSIVTEMLAHAHQQIAAGIPRHEFTTPHFDRDSKLLAAIKAGAASGQALELIYNYQKYLEKGDRWGELWVQDMANAQAVRNRARGVKEILLDQLLLQQERTGRGTIDHPLRQLSLAAGSGQQVIETVAKLRDQGVFVQVTMLDVDHRLEPLIQQYVNRYDLQGQVDFRVGDVFNFAELAPGPFEAVEMLGMLDYVHDRFTKKLMRAIHDVIEPHGFFITCHIHVNQEVPFMRDVINWGVKCREPRRYEMLYRPKDELVEIVESGGFEVPVLWTEPHEIHTVAVGEKV